MAGGGKVAGDEVAEREVVVAGCDFSIVAQEFPLLEVIGLGGAVFAVVSDRTLGRRGCSECEGE